MDREQNDKRNKTVDATVTRKRKLIALTRREGGFPLVSNDKDRDTLCKLVSDNGEPLTKKTIQNYIKQLEKVGYEFECRKETFPQEDRGVDKWLCYYICTKVPSEENVELPEEVKKKKKEEAQDALYLFLLSTYFYKEKVDMKTFSNFVYGNGLYPSQLNKYMAILKRMQEKGLIRLEDNKLSVCADGRKNILVEFVFESESNSEGDKGAYVETYYDFTDAVLNELSRYDGGLDENLQSVKNKYEIAMRDQEDRQIRYLRREKINSEIANAQLIREKLSGIPYQTKAIEVEYKSNNGVLHTVSVFTGLLHFSKNKDALFLLGRKKDSKKIYENIKVSSIVNVKVLKDDNKEFGSEKIKQIYKEMFDATYEKGQRVVVLVKNQAQVKDKFQQLAKVRGAEFIKLDTEEQLRQIIDEEKLSEIKLDQYFDQIKSNRDMPESQEKEGLYIYRDWIRGMSDFSAYLMQFGRSCVALAPKGLRTNIETTMIDLLERYNRRE